MHHVFGSKFAFGYRWSRSETGTEGASWRAPGVVSTQPQLRVPAEKRASRMAGRTVRRQLVGSLSFVEVPGIEVGVILRERVILAERRQLGADVRTNLKRRCRSLGRARDSRPKANRLRWIGCAQGRWKARNPGELCPMTLGCLSWPPRFHSAG